MFTFSTPAIIFRRIDYGDNDLIIKMLTLENGKISVIAKSAKKSVKRFAGILEILSVIDTVCSIGKSKMPILKEATLKKPFFNIRGNVEMTSYASYWVELIDLWIEEGNEQKEYYFMLLNILESLDIKKTSPEVLSIIFQMRFMILSGFTPNLNQCNVCKIELDKFKNNKIAFGLVNGGLLCENCKNNTALKLYISKGTAKHLQWIGTGSLEKAFRAKFSRLTIYEGLSFLETFIPFHLGKDFKSLKILNQIRKTLK